jgi:hypothetical protein
MPTIPSNSANDEEPPIPSDTAPVDTQESTRISLKQEEPSLGSTSPALSPVKTSDGTNEEEPKALPTHVIEHKSSNSQLQVPLDESLSDVAPVPESPTPQSTVHKRSSIRSPLQRSPSRGDLSKITTAEPQFKSGGIMIGAGKAAGAIVNREANGQGTIVENRERERGTRGKKKAV